MAVTIQKARKILGKKAEKMSDEEIMRVINVLTKLSDIAINSVLSMRLEQKKTFIKQNETYLNQTCPN